MEQRARCTGCHAINPEGRWVCYCCGEWLRQDEGLNHRVVPEGWHALQAERAGCSQESGGEPLTAASEPG